VPQYGEASLKAMRKLPPHLTELLVLLDRQRETWHDAAERMIDKAREAHRKDKVARAHRRRARESWAHLQASWTEVEEARNMR